jgi:hypothetical protein
MFRTVELHAQPVELSIRLASVGEAVGPDGEIVTLRAMVPEKPFVLPRLIEVDARLCPTSAVSEEDGRAAIVKSTKLNVIDATV